MRPPRRILALPTILLLAFGAPLAGRAEAPVGEIVHFPGPSIAGAAVELAGRLVKPAGPGPFAALVLLHGCDGTDLASDRIARAFAGWGYVLLELDSFGPRGVTEACTDYVRVSPSVRAKDAHAAQGYLASLPFVDPARIGVLGWSHGGITVLEAIANPYLNEPPRADPFAVAIAFYPYCSTKLVKPDAPLLVLIGDADDWTPAGRCTAMTLTGDAVPDYQLVVYPGATHAFDWPGAPVTYFGHHLRYDPEAARDAYGRVQKFLETHLN